MLGLAAPATVDTAARVAADRGREAVVDLLQVDGPGRAALAARLPASVVLAAHIGRDARAGAPDPASLLGPWATGRRVAVAGGLGPADLPALAAVPGLRVVVGSAVTTTDDPAAAVDTLRAAAGRAVAS